MSDVFISYSRRDSAFVMQLQEALRKAGRSSWVDVQGIRPADDFMRAICDAIDRAQAFVFILSPESLSSSVCARELERAVQGSKRLVPVVCREVQETMVPAALRGLNWIQLAEDPLPRSKLGALFAPRPVDRLVRQLLDAVDVDRPWVRMHTRLWWRAIEWDASGRGTDQLLRGADLASVLALAGDQTREPKLNRLQRSFIDASKLADVPEGEDLARLSGEIAAVKRMHAAGRPAGEDVVAGDKRFDLSSVCEPANEVGGDLVDFFRLDGDRVMFVVGDVAGKGLPAGFFMQSVKTLIKSAALRGPFRLEELVREVDRAGARDNASMLFVSAFIAVLDAQTGTLTYCRAGGESPVLVSGRRDRMSMDLDGAEGVPLCCVEGYDYSAETYQMVPGDTLCAFTDGVAESVNSQGHPFGRDALQSLLRARPPHEAARETCEGILRELTAFRAGAKPVDDLTVLVLRWN